MANTKYKVGDKVRIRDDLVVGKHYGLYFIRSMDNYRNRVATIMNVRNNYYELDVDNLSLGWTDEMLEPVSNDKIVITTDGCTVTAQMYRDGIKSDSATAKCNPEDTFDFNVGAKLAFDRLMDKHKEPIVSNGFKVGDRVNYSGYNATVICIAFDDDLGIEFDEYCKYALHDCSNIPLKDGKSGKRGRCRWFNNDDSNLKHGEAIKYYNGKIVAIKDGTDITKGKIYEVIDGQFEDDVGDLRPVICGNAKSLTHLNEIMNNKFIELVE
jgi:hypothetical protein